MPIEQAPGLLALPNTGSPNPPADIRVLRPALMGILAEWTVIQRRVEALKEREAAGCDPQPRYAARA
jgi:hypothetical protein